MIRRFLPLCLLSFGAPAATDAAPLRHALDWFRELAAATPAPATPSPPK